MDAGRYPEFADFYAAWLHQDWKLEDPTTDEVLRLYMRTDAEAADRLLRELRLLAAGEPSDEDVEQALGPWTSYDPRSEGRHPRQWIDPMISVLSEPA